jgi:vacuolar-type H+-ATPase subunit C/Vma6
MIHKLGERADYVIKKENEINNLSRIVQCSESRSEYASTIKSGFI